MKRRALIGEALKSAPAASEPVLDAADPPSPAPRKSFTNKRLDGFGEAARMVKRPTIRLRPSECTIWPGNARDYAQLTEGRLRTLIDSIIAEGGNRIPAVIRRTPNAALPYELVIGTRRHWAIDWLNANHYPDIELVAIIEDIDDEAAFRLADIENREREDISDLERGRNYKMAVDRYYQGIQLRMAERLKLSKSTLARYIALSEIPQMIIDAFGSPMDLQVRHGDRLLPLLRNSGLRPLMEQEAKALAIEQSHRRSAREAAIPGSVVVARLAESCMPRSRRSRKLALSTPDGTIIGQVENDRARGLTLTLIPSDLSSEQIWEVLRPVVEGARIMRGGKE